MLRGISKARPSRKIALLAAAGVGLLVVVAGGFFGHRAFAAHQAAEAGCARVEQWKQDTAPYLTVGDGKQTTAILGDSYSAGDDLDDRRNGWVYDFAAATGDHVVVNSIGYTGYLAGGYCGDDQFSTRIDQLLDSHPDRIILQGGLNDVGQDADDVAAAAADLIARAGDDADVILVGPPHAPQRADGEQEIDDALRGVAKKAGAEYVSAYGWDLEYNEQGLHLTADGHQEFAGHVAAALTR